MEIIPRTVEESFNPTCYRSRPLLFGRASTLPGLQQISQTYLVYQSRITEQSCGEIYYPRAQNVPETKVRGLKLVERAQWPRAHVLRVHSPTKADEFGIAVGGAHNGTPFIEAQRDQGMRARRSAVALEITYLAQFGSHLAVQPDLQFVINPNTDPRIKNAVAFILRFELSL